ncbi:DUF4232 domain-containing protein [Streptomyces sp. NPDC003470]|uniref:DUF4232 domain-containing protein n=1 Tax=Streptomyces sp. NPDC059701 TaxID=3346914 RepID=UPI0036C2D63E
MSARTTRTRLFAATTVALAALALTACEGDSDTGAESVPSSSAAATGPSAPSAGASASTGGDKAPSGSAGSGTDSHGSAGSSGEAGTSGSGQKGKGSSAGSANGGGSGDTDSQDDMPGKCSAADVKITAQKLSRPLNHLLLTATNTGSKTCMLPPYPAARFGEAQAVPPVAEATKPQSLTGVAPGEAGYAGVLLSAGDGSGENGYETSTLTVPFEDGSIATVALPAGGVYVDTALTVTYWQTDVDAALGF